MRNIDWRKSSYSYSEGNCVEVAYVPECVLVRDSKAVTEGGPNLELSPEIWQSFIDSIKVGQTTL
jgi:hypothetical protein